MDNNERVITTDGDGGSVKAKGWPKRFENLFKNRRQSIGNQHKIMTKSIQNLLKIRLGVPWAVFGLPRATSGALGGSRTANRERRALSILHVFPDLGRFWSPFGVQLGRVGARKSHFFTKNQHKIAIKSFQEAFQKKDEKSMKQ